jgi:hypothetical protein
MPRSALQSSPMPAGLARIDEEHGSPLKDTGSGVASRRVAG